MLGRPGSGEKYKRDNLLGPEAVEACFHGAYKSVVHTRCRERARGTEAASIRRCCERRVMLPAIAPGGVHGQGERGVREGADLVTCESSRVTRES